MRHRIQFGGPGRGTVIAKRMSREGGLLELMRQTPAGAAMLGELLLELGQLRLLLGRLELLLQVVETGSRLAHEGLAVIGSSLGVRRCPGGCVPAE
eukprot:2881134-Prymnesium_polylepis.2